LRIGVVGLGLIGGSLALALRERHDVTGYDIDEAARRAAASDGIRVGSKLDDLVPADAVIVATPMSAIVPTLERLAARSNGAVLLDTGSLKRAVADFAGRAPKDASPRRTDTSSRVGRSSSFPRSVRTTRPWPWRARSRGTPAAR